MKKTLFMSLLLVTHTVSAVFFSSADLYQWLENDLQGLETYQGGMAKGYLMGVLDSLSAARPAQICNPGFISALKLKTVVFNYMQSHPEAMNLSVDKLVYQALLNEWPCR